MDKVGRILAEAREARGMSIDDVASITKVSRSILQAIEDGDSSGLPAPVYVRGFVRAYARAVGADAQEALRLLSQLQLPAEKEDELGVEGTMARPNPALDSGRFAAIFHAAPGERSGLASSHALLLLIVLGMFLAGWMMMGSRTSPDTETAAPEHAPAIQEQVDAVTSYTR